MSDDDWDEVPSERPNAISATAFGSDGGCKFSAGRGFTPRCTNDWGSGTRKDFWGGGAGGGCGNGNNADKGWDDGGGGVDNDGWSRDSAPQESYGGGRGGRGSRVGGRGGRGRPRGGGGGRGGYRGDDHNGFNSESGGGSRYNREDRGFRHNDDDGGFRHNDEDGRGRGRGGRGRGASRGTRNCDFDGRNGEDGGEGERKREIYVPVEVESEELFTSGISCGENFTKFDQVEVKVTGRDPPLPIKSFQAAGLRPLILENIEKSGYTAATPVQKYSIPVIMSGRDLMGCAQTGSGKTAAFLLPIIHNLLTENDSLNTADEAAHPQVIIMSPTRELAIQIHDQAKKFSYNSVVKCVVVYGGTAVNHQRAKVLGGCHILVATPGRLRDFVNRRHISFSNCKYFVLDEADRMLDMGFLDVVSEMLSHQTMPATGERRTLMFSATFPQEIQELATKFLHDYIFLAIGIVGSASTDVEQNFFQLSKFDKRPKLIELLSEFPNERTLVFVETKRNADFIATLLSEKKIPTTSIHGDRFQSEREQALYDFKKGIRKVLIATGVAARGLDIKDVQHVINFDLPNSIDEYVHRIGRTGRVGNRGRATSFFEDRRDDNLSGALAKILSQANQPIPEWLNSQGFGSSADQFTSRDIRGDNFGYGQDVGAPVLEDEVW